MNLSDGARRAFEELRAEINKQNEKKKSVEEIALGFIDVANDTMCRSIRTLTEVQIQILNTPKYSFTFRQRATTLLITFWFVSEELEVCLNT